MRLALAQVNVTIGDFGGILARYRETWERARAEGAAALVLPELATTGYPPRDLLARRPFIERNLEVLAEMAAWTAAGPAIVCGYIHPNYDGPGNDLYNAAALLQGGAVRSRVWKSLLPSYDVFDEDRYFEPATERAPVLLGDTPVALTICEDIWASPELWNKLRYPVDPTDELIGAGARLLINVSASPFSLGKADLRRRLVSEKARQHEVWAVYVNQVGAHDELVFDGRSLVVGPDGCIVRSLAAFEEDFAVVDIPDGALARTAASATSGGPAWPDAMPAEEEAWRALVLGLRDYVRKTGHRRVVLGLSGGIDSALVATIAADALGPDNVLGVAMPTRYSSSHALEDARQLAATLGIPFQVIPIDAAFQAMLDQMAPAFGARPPDLAEENLQARLRGVTLMALSNKFGSLLLATGNKSELAVGYSTLYGDMAGALLVIGDLVKTRVYALARWLNREHERIPVRSITKPPSAELRPDQTDQDSLPPYDLLDQVIEAYVEAELPPAEISLTYGIDRTVVDGIVRLIHRAEYKRRQAAPVLKITGKAFGVGRRMPIVSAWNG